MQVEYSWITPVCHQYTTSIPPVLLQEIYLMSWSVVYPTGESSDERLILQVDNNANLLFGEDGIGYLVVLTKLRIEYGQSMRGWTNSGRNSSYEAVIFSSQNKVWWQLAIWHLQEVKGRVSLMAEPPSAKCKLKWKTWCSIQCGAP